MNGQCCVNRTDDVVKRLVSLEFASQVSFQVPQIHYSSFHEVSKVNNC